MPYQCKLQVEFYTIKEEQMSPLSFGSQLECSRFANKMFNPPETVTSYELVSTNTPANATMKNGKVRMI
jgi:hypothetical protein